jgi:uncharacterized protein (TIGR02611 family)
MNPADSSSHAETGADPPPRHLLPIPWSIWFWLQARKIVVLVVGLTVVLLGIVMLVTPGPGWVTIFAGLVILATEFAWAKWILKNGKERAAQLIEFAKQQMPNQRNGPPGSD